MEMIGATLDEHSSLVEVKYRKDGLVQTVRLRYSTADDATAIFRMNFETLTDLVAIVDSMVKCE